LIILSDAWIGDPLGEAIPGNVPLLQNTHSQSVALLVNSYSDVNLKVLLSLFVAVGFSFQRHSTSNKPLSLSYTLMLCLFGASSILSFFFVTRAKSALLLQMQFERVNVMLIQPALNLHFLFLFIAALCGFFLVLNALVPGPSAQGET
jgi:hypothetical protein